MTAPRHRPTGASPARPSRPAPEPLWREALGTHLRTLRRERAATLADTAKRAGLSPQYLSEVERGRKEPSSEMIAALAGALGTSLAELTAAVAESLRPRRPATVTRIGTVPVSPVPRHGGPAAGSPSSAVRATLLAA